VFYVFLLFSAVGSKAATSAVPVVNKKRQQSRSKEQAQTARIASSAATTLEQKDSMCQTIPFQSLLTVDWTFF